MGITYNNTVYFQDCVHQFNGKDYVWVDDCAALSVRAALKRVYMIEPRNNDLIIIKDAPPEIAQRIESDVVCKYHHMDIENRVKGAKKIIENRKVKIVKHKKPHFVNRVVTVVGVNNKTDGTPMYYQVDMGEQESQRYWMLHPTEVQLENPMQYVGDFYCPLCGNIFDTRPAKKADMGMVCVEVNHDLFHEDDITISKDIKIICGACHDLTQEMYSDRQAQEHFTHNLEQHVKRYELWKLT